MQVLRKGQFYVIELIFQMRAVQKFEKNIKVSLKYCCLAGAQTLTVKYDSPIFDEKVAFMFSEGCKTA